MADAYSRECLGSKVCGSYKLITGKYAFYKRKSFGIYARGFFVVFSFNLPEAKAS